MKKIFFMAVIAMLFATTTSVSAQKNYEELVVEMISASPQYQNITASLENMRPALTGMNKKLLKDQSNSEELVNKYAETQMASDFIAALLVPTLKEHISMAELKEMVKLLSVPEAKTFANHDAIATEKFEKEFQIVFIESLSSKQALKDLENGKLNLKPVEIDASIPADYIATFDKFYNEEYTEEILNSMTGIFNMQLKNNPELQEPLLAYIKTNMRPLCLNVYYGTVTKEDMLWNINHQSKPITKKFADAMLLVMSNMSDQEKMQGVVFNFLMRYAMWLQEQGLEINE
jgi:hypothetical protein